MIYFLSRAGGWISELSKSNVHLIDVKRNPERLNYSVKVVYWMTRRAWNLDPLTANLVIFTWRHSYNDVSVVPFAFFFFDSLFLNFFFF